MLTSSPQNSLEEAFRNWLDIHHPTSRRLIMSMVRKLKLWDITASQDSTEQEILQYSENPASRRRARSAVRAWAIWQKETLGLNHWILEKSKNNDSTWMKDNLSRWDEISLRLKQRIAMAQAISCGFSMKQAALLKSYDETPPELARWKKVRLFFKTMGEGDVISISVKKPAKSGGVWWQQKKVLKKFPSVKKEWAQSDLLFPSFRSGKKIERATWMRIKLKSK
jgi:hypothetical protein